MFPLYDVAVVGAGAAGIMAALRASLRKKQVVLIERNSAIGKKISLSGGGKCNITNTADLDAFMEAFGKQGSFFRQAFFKFFNRDLIEFFSSRGLQMKADASGRVLPATEEASSVIQVLKECLSQNHVKVLYVTRLASIKKDNDYFRLRTERNDSLYAKKVIFATGGASYAATGSSGDGFRLARELGHTIMPLKPALVPLKTKEPWVRELQGLSLGDIRIIFKLGNTKITSPAGEIIFTHFGISGPLALDLSSRIVPCLCEYKEIPLFLDLMPGLKPQALEDKLSQVFVANRNARLKNAMKSLLPHRLIPVILEKASVSVEEKVSRLSPKARHEIIRVLKNLPLTVVGALPLEQAMVTNGGVSMKEIDPRTMESRIVPGLYFAGEIIDGCGLSGGYNLQQAFSTGYLAGEKAGEQ